MSFKDQPIYKIITYGLEIFGRYYGSYRAFVVSNEDELKMNRIQLIIPHLNATAVDETWAWPQGVWGGDGYGMQLLPKVGDMVWVEFEYGDPDYPVWKHAGYSKDELPDEFVTPDHYGFKTPRGTIILVNDNKDEEEILVKLNNNDEWLKVIKEELEIQAKIIKLGKDGQEWAVMGETLLSKMDSIMDKLDQTYKATLTHIHPTNVGPSGPPTNAATFTEIKAAMQNIKEALPEFLSAKVKIDKTNGTRENSTEE